mmetsp:Transcript_23862/g.42289  ORF Transcript_23862/g.42289 Transcript_23862/m.42289 type:complete len:263 (-) Transcript_23862:717-1505(-)
MQSPHRNRISPRLVSRHFLHSLRDQYPTKHRLRVLDLRLPQASDHSRVSAHILVLSMPWLYHFFDNNSDSWNRRRTRPFRGGAQHRLHGFRLVLLHRVRSDRLRSLREDVQSEMPDDRQTQCQKIQVRHGLRHRLLEIRRNRPNTRGDCLVIVDPSLPSRVGPTVRQRQPGRLLSFDWPLQVRGCSHIRSCAPLPSLCVLMLHALGLLPRPQHSRGIRRAQMDHSSNRFVARDPLPHAVSRVDDLGTTDHVDAHYDDCLLRE